MTEAIFNILEQIEEEHNVEILYAVESGSRVWGFESVNSDWDIRFVYKRPFNKYLSLKQQKRDTIEKTYEEGYLDFSGWDLKKAFLLFNKGNPSFMEWLDSPIIYKEKTGLFQQLRELKQKYYIQHTKTGMYHYLHMANNNFSKYLYKKGLALDEVILKKYLYVLRPILICKWLEHYREKKIPVAFQPLLDTFLSDSKNKELRKEIDILIEKKKKGNELGKDKVIPVLHHFLQDELSYYSEHIDKLALDKINYSLNNKKLQELDEIYISFLLKEKGIHD